MSQQQKDALKEMISKAPLDIGGDVIEQRPNFEKMLSARPLAEDVSTTPGELGGVPVLSIETGMASHDAVLLWFHGGWYAIGSPRTSAELSSDLARRIDAKVISVDTGSRRSTPTRRRCRTHARPTRVFWTAAQTRGRSRSLASRRAVVWPSRCSHRWPRLDWRSRAPPSCSHHGPTSRSAARR